MGRKKRDIYKCRFDKGFDIDKDVDLQHLRELMTKEAVDAIEYNYYGLYLKNIINIALNASSFRGYPDDVKCDMSSEALLDGLKARTKFDSEKYEQATAPFNYLYRIIYHSFQHVLAKYYTMQNRMVPASLVGQLKLADGDECTKDILDKAVTDWDAVAEHIRQNPTVVKHSEDCCP